MTSDWEHCFEKFNVFHLFLLCEKFNSKSEKWLASFEINISSKEIITQADEYSFINVLLTEKVLHMCKQVVHRKRNALKKSLNLKSNSYSCELLSWIRWNIDPNVHWERFMLLKVTTWSRFPDQGYLNQLAYNTEIILIFGFLGSAHVTTDTLNGNS